MRGLMFLRCGIAGLLGGLLLLGSPELGMLWQGLALIALGGLSLVIWYRGIGSRDLPRPRKVVQGPTFEADDPKAPDLAPTTRRLVQNVRLTRQRQKRAED